MNVLLADAAAGFSTSLSRRRLATPYPFDAPEFTEAWWAALAQKFPVLARLGDWTLVEKRSLKGLVRLRELRIAGWNVASEWGQTLETERLDDFFALADEWPWDALRLRWRADHRPVEALERLREAGFSPIEIPGPTFYAVDLRQGLEGYLESLSVNARRNFKRKRQQTRDLSGALEHAVQGESDCSLAFDAFLDQFITYHCAYWRRKTGAAYLDDPREQAFLRQWTQGLREVDALRLWRLRLDGDIASMGIAMTFGEERYWPLIVNTGLYSAHRPGVLTVCAAIEQSADEGMRWLHLGAGDAFYKQQFANHRDILHEVWVANPKSPRGLAVSAALRLKSRLRASDGA